MPRPRLRCALMSLPLLAVVGCGADVTAGSPTGTPPVTAPASSPSASASSPSATADAGSTSRSGSAPSPTATGSKPVTVAAAGDIAKRASDGEGTARLIEAIGPDAVLTLGDNAYDSGRLSEYMEKYDPTWGRFKAITYPVPGNHEYRTDGASGYFDYFRDQVRDREYYAWTMGDWRFYALNCEIDCEAGSPQLNWLRSDLARQAGKHVLGYLHQPRFTCSSEHSPQTEVSDLWRVLQQADGRIMLAGHNHAYERFRPLDAAGTPDADGLHQFVVGTGGARAYPLARTCQNRQAGYDDSPGVLKLQLGRDAFAWQFISVDGKVRDEGRVAL